MIQSEPISGQARCGCAEVNLDRSLGDGTGGNLGGATSGSLSREIGAGRVRMVASPCPRNQAANHRV